MGAVAGSWAGLHGPGEKTIKKTGQSGPGPYKGPGVRDRGPGQRAAGHPSRKGGPGVPGPAGRRPGTGRGQEAREAGGAPRGLLLPQLPGWAVLRPDSHPWGAQKRLSEPLYLGSPPTHHVEASGGFRSWLPLGIHSQKPGPPPSGGAGKLQATTVWTGCWYSCGHLSLPLSTWALVNLWAWRMASWWLSPAHRHPQQPELQAHSTQAPRPFGRL